ncbi:uncharacterized protein LOC119838515 [Zerene cesonia]|uniref:uncharacterized protein LOC119838515 n=1 Tax=Zerene cesonia TaxID=33412 RepID=UPI0018E53144|nr:uncharacterized protein LOC119838515 [Zerene cesonia]XP_038220415.1 uncharacterized protein LOC119838515 [Zerene cesonia]
MAATLIRLTLTLVALVSAIHGQYSDLVPTLDIDMQSDDANDTLSEIASETDKPILKTNDGETTEPVLEGPKLSDPARAEHEGANDDRTESSNEATGQDITAATDVTTSSDNNVYTAKEPMEDIYSNQDAYNVQVESTATTTHTSDAVDGFPPKPAEFEQEEQDYSGQRSPKTDNSNTLPPMDARTFEKPKPLPAASKSATLRAWLEDTWLRPPVGVLVPLRPDALARALAVWNDVTADGLNLTDIVIVGYDSNGVNWRSRHNLQPSSATGDRAVGSALSKLLHKYQGVYTSTASDGTMRALASAAKLVPYDSALFLVTDRAPGDAQRLPLALRALVEKRLKVYTVWTDPSHPAPESELALQDLRNVSSHTEGEVLPYALPNTDDDTSILAELQQWNPTEAQPRREARVKTYPETDDYDTLLMRKGEGEALSLGLPIDNGVTALKIYLEGAVEHAVLYPPNDGAQIDLYNASSIRAFSPPSTAEGTSPRIVHLVFPTSLDDTLTVLPAEATDAADRSLAGTWHLSVRCDACVYRLRVAARSSLHLRVDVVDDMLQMKIYGPVASVRDTILVDEYGSELAKLPFNYQPTSDIDESSANADIQAELQMPNVASSSVYVKIFGRDIKGEPFTRLSRQIQKHTEVRMGRSASIVFPESPNDLEIVENLNSELFNRLEYNDSNVLPFGRATSQVVNQSGSVLTAVQIGLSTRLYGAPGVRLQLYFEVTNYREQSVRFNFGAVGELRFLTGIEPSSQTVASGQTVTVIVSLLISATAQPGARDLITFTAYGNEAVSISAYVYVLNQGQSINDASPPSIRHNFQGSCLLKQGSDCNEHVWSATIIARDSEGGLLRLTSSPQGVIYDSNFISGSRDDVTATYRATCCSPRVVVNAVDAFGNTNSYIVDISNYFPPSAIAAIALGIILFIGILVLIIFLIYWCVKRRKEVRELPTYTSRNVN